MGKEKDLLSIVHKSLQPVNISTYLAKKYGGKWKYDHRGTWWCDDNKRHVSRVNMCGCDYECGHAPGYFIYGGESTQAVNW